MFYPLSGSSLQAQGTRLLPLAFLFLLRFIPAGAGNTTQHHSAGRNHPVHPCRRREHLASVERAKVPDGSSLQAQGTLDRPPPGQLPDRFIPAGAGNTRNLCSLCRVCTVHPCRRREHINSDPVCLWEIGSSLQAQGTRHLFLDSVLVDRFIPAGAGNTEMLAGLLITEPVHPCRRREHRQGR